MTLEELKKYDGKEGRPAYVACNGKIYDVTKSDFWKDGKHMGQQAGQDLSSKIGLSPHGEANLFRFPVVGELTTDETKENKSEATPKDPKLAKKLKQQELYRKFHPHPIMVHFPMGMFPFAFVAQLLALIFTDVSIYFSASAVFAVTLGTLFLFPAILSGMLSLVINYNGKPNVILKRKIILSAVLLVISLYGTITGLKALYYNVCPTVAGIVPADPIGVGFFVVVLLINAVAFSVAANGGKITWPQ